MCKSLNRVPLRKVSVPEWEVVTKRIATIEGVVEDVVEKQDVDKMLEQSLASFLYTK